MITEAEIRRLAGGWRVDPMILNLDYSLTWLLAALAGTPGASDCLRFKGGTCLRKCYFPGYRFSEDLDFTAATSLAPEQLSRWVEQAIRWSAAYDGPDFARGPYRLEIVNDEYGQEAYQVRVYFRGPLRWDGSPQAIRIDVTRDERLLLPVEMRPLLHAYSDSAALEGSQVACYTLPEILAEKVRAITGQRRFAVSRDLYDIHHLVRSGVTAEALARILPDKFQARRVDLAALDAARLGQRRAEYASDWHRRLAHLIPNSEAVSFDEAWSTAVGLTVQLTAILQPGG